MAISDIDPALIVNAKYNQDDLLYYNAVTGFYEWNNNSPGALDQGLVLYTGQTFFPTVYSGGTRVWIGPNQPPYATDGSPWFWIKTGLNGGADTGLAYSDGNP